MDNSPSLWQLLAAIFILVWAILWMIMPFILMSINSKLAENNNLLRQLLTKGQPPNEEQPKKIGIFD